MPCSVLSVYEVQKVDTGKGVEIRDIFGDRVCTVADNNAAKTLCKWDRSLWRFIEIGASASWAACRSICHPSEAQAFHRAEPARDLS